MGCICISALAPLLPCFFYFTLIVQKKQPKGAKFYASVVIFSVMLPYSIFAMVSLYLDKD